VRRASPLAIDDFVEVIGCGDISIFHHASRAPKDRFDSIARRIGLFLNVESAPVI
jgi:hypothetical protein